MSQQYFQYNDPLRIIWRAGTPEDPYVDKLDTLKIINNKVVLSEIPSRSHGVSIGGYVEVNLNVNRRTTELKVNEFLVNYSNGIIQFNPENDAKTVTVSYKGRGIIQYPSDRIYHYDENNDVVETLNIIIDRALESVESAQVNVDRVNQAIQRSEIATNNANVATDRAISATDETILATTEAYKAVDTTKKIFQQPVSTYDQIFIAYPDPLLGYTVMTMDTGSIYRWDGIEWKFIENWTGSILPLASQTTNGLMSSVNFTKLLGIEDNAQVNPSPQEIKESLGDEMKARYIIYVLSDTPEAGVQDVIIRFPFDGVISNAHAHAIDAGVNDTVIDIEKASKDEYEAGIGWQSILRDKLIFNTGEIVSSNPSFSEVNVSKDDYFRLNLLQVGANIENITVQLEIIV